MGAFAQALQPQNTVCKHSVCVATVPGNRECVHTGQPPAHPCSGQASAVCHQSTATPCQQHLTCCAHDKSTLGILVRCQQSWGRRNTAIRHAHAPQLHDTTHNVTGAELRHTTAATYYANNHQNAAATTRQRLPPQARGHTHTHTDFATHRAAVCTRTSKRPSSHQGVDVATLAVTLTTTVTAASTLTAAGAAHTRHGCPPHSSSPGEAAAASTHGSQGASAPQ